MEFFMKIFYCIMIAEDENCINMIAILWKHKANVIYFKLINYCVCNIITRNVIHSVSHGENLFVRMWANSMEQLFKLCNFSRVNHVFRAFLDCEITASFHPMPILYRAFAYTLAKTFYWDVVHFRRKLMYCRKDGCARHDWNSSTEFLYVPCSWDRRSTLARKSRGGGTHGGSMRN